MYVLHMWCVCMHAHVVCSRQDQIGRKLSVMPVGEEVTMVTWEELEQAITDGWRASQQVNKWGAWAVVSGGAPLNLSLFTTTQYSIMWMFIIYFTCFLLWIFLMFFSQSYKKPCSSVTFTQ